MPKCKACGAIIKWVKTVDHKNMPVESKPVKVLIAGPLGEFRTYTGFLPHWGNCPKADKFRKSKRGDYG